MLRSCSSDSVLIADDGTGPREDIKASERDEVSFSDLQWPPVTIGLEGRVTSYLMCYIDSAASSPVQVQRLHSRTTLVRGILSLGVPGPDALWRRLALTGALTPLGTICYCSRWIPRIQCITTMSPQQRTMGKKEHGLGHLGRSTFFQEIFLVMSNPMTPKHDLGYQSSLWTAKRPKCE
jgi:hypothetical protein